MKVHYINILLFAHALNILAHNNNNEPSITHHTQTNRSLCECELYGSVNYDNDPEMKSVMDNFNKQTQQRFHEYDERMQEKRKRCKDQRDKESQKIILKDKLEKELMDKFSTLQTDIQSDAIPTCICEKSIADKVEKGCLRCTQNLGGIVAPSTGVLAGIGEAAISVLKPAALKAAARYAMKEGASQGLAAGNTLGMDIVTSGLKTLKLDMLVPDICEKVSSTGNYANVTNFADIIIKERGAKCGTSPTLGDAMCQRININLRTLTADGRKPLLPDELGVEKTLNVILEEAKQGADALAKDTAKKVTTAIQAEKTDLINTIYGTWETTIIASIVAIVVIVLIMVIIYLILRRRRKKKMKKKLQYIKLLEE
nr:rifin PIR protein,putative [Plasmodium sp. DRC-Itaito]